LIRRELYLYNNNQLYQIKCAVPDVYTWWIYFDFGSALAKWPSTDRDTIDLISDSVKINPKMKGMTWYDPGKFHYTYIPDENQNVTDFYYVDTRLLLSYDTLENPLFKFKSTRPLPIRISANNIVGIESRFVGPESAGSVIWNYIANIKYEYDETGRPIKALKSYRCGPTDTIKYVYDKINIPR
jgi:hypothetical protein